MQGQCLMWAGFSEAWALTKAHCVSVWKETCAYVEHQGNLANQVVVMSSYTQEGSEEM